MSMRGTRSQAGFTIPELLVVVGIFLVFVLIALAFLRPKDFGPQIRNADRWSDIASISMALKSYAADNNGTLPPGITAKTQIIGSSVENGAVNICRYLVPKYLKTMPTDPGGLDASVKNCAEEGAKYVAGYAVAQYVDGSVVVSAPVAENNEQISLRIPAFALKPAR